MHENAMIAMQEMLGRAPEWAKAVLDVGSLDINGVYKPMILERGWQYTGIDIQDGNNVDYVVEPYSYPFPDNSFDIVMSGSCMEHVERPWLWIPELARVLKPGGLLAIVTHHTFPFHEYPWDCYRFFPRAFMVLFDDTRMLEDYRIRIHSDQDIIASAIKRPQ